MRENVVDLAYRNDVAPVFRSEIENGFGRRGHRIIAPVMSSDVARLRAAKRTGNDPCYVKRDQKLAGDLANLVKPLQSKFLLVCRDLKDAVGRRVANRHSRAT